MPLLADLTEAPGANIEREHESNGKGNEGREGRVGESAGGTNLHLAVVQKESTGRPCRSSMDPQGKKVAFCDLWSLDVLKSAMAKTSTASTPMARQRCGVHSISWQIMDCNAIMRHGKPKFT